MGTSSMMTAIVYLGACLQLLGASIALDAYAGMPWAPVGYPQSYCDDANASCTRTLLGGPIQYGDETECYLPTSFGDPWYSAYCAFWWDGNALNSHEDT